MPVKRSKTCRRLRVSVKPHERAISCSGSFRSAVSIFFACSMRTRQMVFVGRAGKALAEVLRQPTARPARNLNETLDTERFAHVLPDVAHGRCELRIVDGDDVGRTPLNDLVRRHQDFLRGARLLADQSAQQRSRLPPDFMVAARNAAQRHAAQFANHLVVVHADHRHVGRNAQPQPRARIDDHRRAQVDACHDPDRQRQRSQPPVPAVRTTAGRSQRPRRARRLQDRTLAARPPDPPQETPLALRRRPHATHAEIAEVPNPRSIK